MFGAYTESRAGLVFTGQTEPAGHIRKTHALVDSFTDAGEETSRQWHPEAVGSFPDFHG